MKFLVIAKSVHPIPPEMALGIFDATIAWHKRTKESGKFESAWGLAGLPAGAGVVNVASLEELQAIMAEFPLQPFSNIEVYPLVDINVSMESTKKAILAMMPPGAGR